MVDDPGADDLEQWATWFRALADPTRLRILHHVSGTTEPMTVGRIVTDLDLTQSNVSHHLKILAHERFVLTERDGLRTLVRANPSCMTALPDALATIMRGPDPT